MSQYADHYTRNGNVLFNNRPLNTMGKPGTTAHKILRVLSGDMSPEQIAEAAHIPVPLARQTLFRLSERGFVRKVGECRHYRYRRTA